MNICISYLVSLIPIIYTFYRPISAMLPFRAFFIGSLSGSFAEGSPLQSQR